MSDAPTKVLKCTECGRSIEACACCDERDCRSPICDRGLTETLLKSVRHLYVHSGASITWEAGQVRQ